MKKDFFNLSCCRGVFFAMTFIGLLPASLQKWGQAAGSHEDKLSMRMQDSNGKVMTIPHWASMTAFLLVIVGFSLLFGLQIGLNDFWRRKAAKDSLRTKNPETVANETEGEDENEQIEGQSQPQNPGHCVSQ